MQVNITSADTKPRLKGQTEKEEPEKETKNMPHETGIGGIPEGQERR